MVHLAQLVMPIVLSSVFVFIASSLIHMLSPWHKTDYGRVPDEEAFRRAVGPLNIPPGDYMIPRPQTMADLKTPEFGQKVTQGPNIVMTVMPNQAMNMGRNLGLWFVYIIAVVVFAAYVAGRALVSGAPTREVVRYVATTAFIGFAVALWQMSIWYRRAWSTTIKATVDGLIYSLITGATFAWMWPQG